MVSPPASRSGARSRAPWIFLVTVLAAGAWATPAWRSWVRKVEPRDLSAEITVPAGEFIFRDGQKVRLEEFRIDRYEVTVFQYQAFIDALPHGDPKRFDHPEQPAAKKSHFPPGWADLVRAARRGGRFMETPVTLNSPVSSVDWWDAWAYAKWRDRRLPTEEEWEKAARGTDGRPWPWGAEADPSAANISSATWADVDAFPRDISPYGVTGMAGNVAEWTASLVPHPDLPDVQRPVYRGGDFHQTGAAPLNAPPRMAKDALHALPSLGFRTALSSPSSAP